MKTTLTILLSLLLVGILAGGALAQSGPGSGDGVCNFIDEDGDGFNDLAPDADGDGIPNGLDPDYVKPEDGTGSRHGWGRYARLMVQAFGEGGSMAGEGGNRFGPGDGTGTGVGPADHAGFGPGTGDGTGDGVQLGNRSQRRGENQ
ncbi:MAG: hypothetical protein AB7V45_01755 [Candidatus Krumholzibacteriia bacterium]